MSPYAQQSPRQDAVFGELGLSEVAAHGPQHFLTLVVAVPS